MSQSLRVIEHAVRRARKPANVSLDSALLGEAKSLGVNVSRACEAGLNEEVRKLRLRKWQDENQRAIKAYNRRVEKWGTPSEYLMGLRDGSV